MSGRSLVFHRGFIRFNWLDALFLLLAAGLLFPAGYYVHGILIQRWDPEIKDVEPLRIRRGADTLLRIKGVRFDRWSRVMVDGQPVNPVRFLDEQQLQVDLPLNIQKGPHTVEVVSFRQRTAVLNHAFEVIDPPPQVPVRMGVVCLLVGVTPQQKRQLSVILASERYRESEEGVYLQRFHRSGPVLPKSPEEWLLINVHLSGIIDHTTPHKHFLYQGRVVEPGEPIDLKLGQMELAGWVTAMPQFIRIIRQQAQ